LLEALIEIDSAPDANEKIVFSTHTLNKMRLSQDCYISHKYSRDNTLVVIVLDHEMETRLMQEQPIQGAERDHLLGAFYQELGDLPPTAQNPIVLTTIESRKKLKNLISKEFPQVAVVCYHDLATDMNIQPIGRISWNG
jgi:type III secretion protein V